MKEFKHVSGELAGICFQTLQCLNGIKGRYEILFNVKIQILRIQGTKLCVIAHNDVFGAENH